MELRIEANRALWRQLADAVRSEIAAGKLRPGDKLRPAQELAASAGVSPNAMKRALESLVEEGILSREAGSYEVSGGGTDQRERILREKCAAFLREMTALGFAREEILESLQEVL